MFFAIPEFTPDIYDSSDGVAIFTSTPTLLTASSTTPVRPDGDNALDITAVHPSNYEQTEKLLNKAGFNKEDLRNKEKLQELREKLKFINVQETAKELDIGEMTLQDIIEVCSHAQCRVKFASQISHVSA